MGCETLRIRELRPVRRGVHGNAEVPRRVAVQFAHRPRVAVVGTRREEAHVGIPAFFRQCATDALRLRLEFVGERLPPRPAGDGSDVLRLAPHRRVHERLPSAAAERELRSLVVVYGKEPALAVAAHASLAGGRTRNDHALEALLPARVVPDGGIQQFDGQFVEPARLRKLARPREEPARIRPAVLGPFVGEPETRVVGEILRIAQPAAFAEVVPGRAHDRVVYAAPRHLREELRHAPSAVAPAQMLAVRPPAEVVRSFDVLVRAGKARHVAEHEILGCRVGNRVRVQLFVRRVEPAHILRKKRLRVRQALRRRLKVEPVVYRAADVFRTPIPAVVPEKPAVIGGVAQNGRLVRGA